MSWDVPDPPWRFAVPDRSWRFAVDGDPPADLPAPWATATRAVTRDLACRRHGRPITFANVLWCFQVSDEWIAVGFDTRGEADVSVYQRCVDYRLDTSPTQALVWLAYDVQYELTGSEFVQWPIAGQRILDPRIVDDRAVWVEPATNTVTAPIGELCPDPNDL